MKKATQQFLKYRPNAQYIETVEHRPNSNYQRRECMNMSVIEAKDFGTKFITGWLVDNYYENINATPIIHHCWNIDNGVHYDTIPTNCLLYTSPSPRDGLLSRMPSSA